MNLEVDKYNDSDYLIEREESINGLEKEEKINWEQMYLDEVDKHVDVVLLYNSLLNKIKSYDKELENARKINEEHRKENAELMKAINVVEKEKGEWIEDCNNLKEKVRKLEKENSTLKNFTSDLFNEDITQTFICKDKIKDKIEELKQALENTNKDRWKTVYTVQIEILQRLLQEEDK